MSDAEFDRYVHHYEAMHRKSIGFSGCEPEYFARYKVNFASRHSRDRSVVLDFGAGTGNSIPHFRNYFPGSELVCADVSGDSLEYAAGRFPGNERYIRFGDRLPLANDSASLCFAACVFHHILPQEHVRWLTELFRVTRPGGMLAVFEHNPRNPLTRKAVDRCEFDKDAILIRPETLRAAMAAAGWSDLKLHYHVFFPGFLARLRPVEPLLAWLPLGGQYSILGLKH